MALKRKRIAFFLGAAFLVAALAFLFSWNDFFILRMKAYSMPAGSMMPTIQVGDNFIARRHFPIFGETYSPVAGDVIVFRTPNNPGTIYVDRLIGLPGDKVQLEGGVVHINGKPVRRERMDDFTGQNAAGEVRQTPRYRETLPGGRSYETLDLKEDAPLDDTREYVVPDGHLFVLGDNRDNSVDSRVLGPFGYVPVDYVIGVVEQLYYSGETREFVWRPIDAVSE